MRSAPSDATIYADRIPPVEPAIEAQNRTEVHSVSAAGVKTVLGSAYALGAEYSLSKRTDLFAHYGDQDNAVQSAYRVGITHKF
jgi:predicted porin